MLACCPELDQFRQELVMRAFKKIDRAGVGRVTLNDLQQAFCGGQHPDVRSGACTADEVVYEFAQTLHAYRQLIGRSAHSDTVEMREFVDYYRNVSAAISDDSQFEQLMTCAWNLNNHFQQTKKQSYY